MNEGETINLKTVAVASVQGADISLHELLHNLHVKGRLRALLTEAILDKIIARAVQQQGIQVDTAELQKAANAFRTSHGLHKRADFQRWLDRNQLSPEQFESGLESMLLTEKLADQVASSSAVAEHFARNRTGFDRARLAHLVVEKQAQADELLCQLRDDGADFADLVRKHSLDEDTRLNGGRLGIVPRKQMNPALAAAAFSAQKGDVIGPFKNGRGYQLLKVEDIMLGQLDARTAAAIRQLLFRRWLQEQQQTAKVEVNLHRYL